MNGADDRIWLTCLNGDIPVGFCSAQTEFLTDRTWNMHALAVDPSEHRAGHGRALVRALETHLIETGQRVLVIDTSSDPSQVPACAFYKAMGYAEVGRIPEFWSPGEDKISFSKLLD